MDDLELERGMTEGTTTEEIMEGGARVESEARVEMKKGELRVKKKEVEARVEAETGEARAKMKEEEARVELP